MATLADILRQTGYAQDGQLSAPTPVEPTMTSILQKHIATLPQQLATNQAAMDSAMGGWNKTDFATGQPNPNYRPEAMQELTQLMPNVGALTAWHGTPHKIVGNFDINKVGTGEGAQAYGHGMYFAEAPEVAKGYQQTLGKSELSVGGKDLEGSQKFVADRLRNSTYEDTLGWINANKKTFGKEKTAEYKNVLENLKETPIEARTGNLYKVDIPDEHIPNMLDWDKPLSQQTEAVRNALKKHENINTQKVLDGRLKTRETLVKEGKDTTNIDRQIGILREEIADPTLPEMTGEKYYSMYANRFNNMKDTSDYLHSLGVKGIRYLDQGSRTPGFSSLTPTQLESRIASLQTDIKSGAGNTQKMKDQLKGLQNELDSYKNMTSNFVVFDPSTVKILEENNKPVTRKEKIAQEVEKALK